MRYPYAVIHWEGTEFVGSAHCDTQQGCIDFVTNLLSSGFKYNVRIVEHKIADAMTCAKLIDEGCYTMDYFTKGDKKHRRNNIECNKLAEYHGIKPEEMAALVGRYLGGMYNQKAK